MRQKQQLEVGALVNPDLVLTIVAMWQEWIIDEREDQQSINRPRTALQLVADAVEESMTYYYRFGRVRWNLCGAMSEHIKTRWGCLGLL
ncbi:unnamed protein product, partial [Amoebophrya sp. A25]|eukprot:GSA25T00003726001.1